MKHRGVIAAALAVSIFCLGCSATQTSTTDSSEKKDLAVAEVEQKVETVKAVTVVPTPDPTPMPTPEPTPEVAEEPEPTPEPEITYNSRLYAYVVPEPEPEPEINYDYYEGVETGEYHEDVPVPASPSDEWVYYGSCRITHYCNCSICCGQWAGGNTASGAYPTAGRTVACGEDIPFGAEVMINGNVYVCEDRGVGSGCVDIFCGSHNEALSRGMYYTDVYVRY